MLPLRQRRTAAKRRLSAAAPFGVAVWCHRATVRRCEISGSAVGGMRWLTSVARPHTSCLSELNL